MPPRLTVRDAKLHLGRHILAALVMGVSAILLGCPAHIDHNRSIVREVDLHGGTQINEAELRERLSTRETSYFPSNSPHFLRWWRWWWVEPEYFDANAVDRDQLRLRRYLQARGFYDAVVHDPSLTTLSPGHVRVDYAFTEGIPTTVADIRLRGCDPGYGQTLPPNVCSTIRGRFDLRPGGRFDEDEFTHDRQQVEDFTREAGYPSPRVVPRSVVDPEHHLAWLEYTVIPGPLGHFGAIHLLTLPDLTPVTGPTLSNGVPTSVIRSALGISTGDPYSRTVLATGQQALFDLGVFGIARIEEAAQADGRVDLNVQLSSTRLWRLRLGGGFQGDNVNLNTHLLAAYEHRNFFGGLRRLRVEVRPELYLPIAAFQTASNGITLRPGVSTLIELHQPELLPHTAGVLSTGFDYGPDPYNPAVVYREQYRAAIGLEHRFSSHVTGAAYVRFSQAAYTPINGALTDPLFLQQYINQSYAFLDLSITWDRRDDRVRTTRGTLITATLDGSFTPLSNYDFIRARVDGRGYVRLGTHVVWATRALVGAIVGMNTSDSNGWPVPAELRFYSGGAQSNRGYSFNRVGVLSTVPLAGGSTPDDPTRYIAMGGTEAWEFSTEVRWQPGALGLVAFFDASNVVGIDPTYFANPQGTTSGACYPPSNNPLTSTTACPTGVPAPAPLSATNAFGQLFLTPHPSVGIGLRYITPIGPLRIDVGVPLTDLGCSTAATEISHQTAGLSLHNPSYFVTTAPRCNFFGLTSVPAVFNFAIGEAY